MADSDDSIEEFLANYAPDIAVICQKLRAIVKGAMPPAHEVLYASQNHIGYSLSDKTHEQIMYICPMKDYVRLGFMWGGQLPDPDHLLMGEGKRLRHIKVRSTNDANRPALKQLVEAAWTDAPAHTKAGKP